jgi:bud emergence protein 1
LAFSKGDFFHVISREDDPDWYEACNPLIPSARGLVPVSFFEVIGKTEKTERHSAGSAESAKQEPHDSGFSDRSGPDHQDSTNTTRKGASFRMSAIARGQGAMVYGIVMYDFHAERPDELEAKAGEAIIVSAISNEEWFVAKPIGRLGGPGLIPVSFIEIRDMTTGQAVPDAHEAVKRAGVLPVEEWKKLTAEYKNSSITLGKFDTGPPMQSISNGMEKLSMNGNRGQSQIGNEQVRGPAKDPNKSRRTAIDSSFILSRITIPDPAARQMDILSLVMLRRRLPSSNHHSTRHRRRTRTGSWPPCLLPSLDTVSTMTNTGTLLRRRWKMAVCGNCHDTITTFTIFRSPC